MQNSMDHSFFIPGTGTESNFLNSKKSFYPIKISLNVFVPHRNVDKKFGTPLNFPFLQQKI